MPWGSTKQAILFGIQVPQTRDWNAQQNRKACNKCLIRQLKRPDQLKKSHRVLGEGILSGKRCRTNLGVCAPLDGLIFLLLPPATVQRACVKKAAVSCSFHDGRYSVLISGVG
jgi:hypothetical protein